MLVSAVVILRADSVVCHPCQLLSHTGVYRAETIVLQISEYSAEKNQINVLTVVCIVCTSLYYFTCVLRA